LVDRDADGLAIFTTCSDNYVSMASVLLASARRFHPEATIYLCLADKLLPNEGQRSKKMKMTYGRTKP
jgi:hypothetical protein